MYYPVLLNLTSRRCVVVGGGSVGERRVDGLLRAGAHVVLIAPETSSRLREMAEDGAITWQARGYAAGDLNDAFLVIVATTDAAVNDKICQNALENGILVCRADEPDTGSFITPAVVQRGDLIIALATGGNSPTLTAVLKRRLENEFGPEWAAWTELFGRLRMSLQLVADEQSRRAMVERILSEADVQKLIVLGDVDRAEREAQRCISSQSA